MTILNQNFTLLTTGNPKEMVDLANQVDDLMTSIARKSPNLDSTRVAVFACLHLADQLRQTVAPNAVPTAIPDDKIIEFTRLLDQAIG